MNVELESINDVAKVVGPRLRIEALLASALLAPDAFNGGSTLFFTVSEIGKIPFDHPI